MQLTRPSQLPNLQPVGDSGLWSLSDQGLAALSYPEDANKACRSIEDVSYWFRHRNACVSELIKSRLDDGLLLDVCH